MNAGTSDEQLGVLDVLGLNSNNSEIYGPHLWKSGYDEDEDDVEEFTEEELANDPGKRILWAAENNKLEIVTDILRAQPELVASHDGDLYTPLHRASYNNHKDMAQLLLSHGADVNSRTADGWQPLHSAARWNSVETAQLLIHAGADVNAKTNGNLTPLHLAAAEPENGLMLEFLLMTPFIDINIKSKAGETAKEICYRSSPFYKLFDLMDECVITLQAQTTR